MTGSSELARVSVVRVRVGRDRVEATVRLAPGVPMRTSSSPGFAGRVLAVLPGLIRHRCECGSKHGIAAELADTEVPHALEHVALELMARAGSPRTLEGVTYWDFAADGRGVFRVAVDYDDDLVALAALREAATIVAAALDARGPAIDAGAALARVRRARAHHTRTRAAVREGAG